MYKINSFVHKFNKPSVIVFIIFLLAVLLRIPFLFTELPPYQFCDETIYFNQLIRLIEQTNRPYDFYEFRAGGFNFLPMLPISYLVNLLPYDNELTLIFFGRLFFNVLLSSASVFFIYKLTFLLSNSKKVSYLSILFFLLSPYIFSVSRYWYPDHYIYFFSAGFFYYLFLILKSKKINILDFKKISIIFALLLSIKYTSILLSICFLFILYKFFPLNVNSKKLFNIFKTSFIYFFVTLIIFNIGILFEPAEFIKGFYFNLENYQRFQANNIFESSNYYFLVFFLSSLTFLSLPYTLLGLKKLLMNQAYFFLVISFTVIFFILYLGLNRGLALHRNVSILMPLIFPIVAIGFSESIVLSKKYKFKFLFTIYNYSFISYLIFCIFISFSNSVKPDSRVMANNWIKNNLNKNATIGTNEFCSGVSPAAGYSITVSKDKTFAKNYDFYVINSYWKSAIDYKYFATKPIYLLKDQSVMHFNYFNYKNYFKPSNKDKPKNLEKDYELIKEFNGSGPKIFIYKKK